MTIKEFLNKVEEIENNYSFSAMTNIYINGKCVEPQIVEKDWYHSWHLDSVSYERVNVIIIRCYTTGCDEFGFDFSIYNFAHYIKSVVSEGKLLLNEPIYLLDGEYIEGKNIYEIKEISYNFDEDSINVYSGDILSKD